MADDRGARRAVVGDLGDALLVALRADRAAEVLAPTGRSVDAWTARS